ncbi:hypothetical protein F5Y09DRAFT_153492 [Xylaria sp. FL1042]|nr:hypothetical protein F5Y09DRAFT_153492 [Xylaria sp. FL1042]
MICRQCTSRGTLLLIAYILLARPRDSWPAVHANILLEAAKVTCTLTPHQAEVQNNRCIHQTIHTRGYAVERLQISR